MQVLITGGAGFIGSRLTEALLAKGHAVACIDNFNDYYDPAIKRANLATSLKNENFKLFESDIVQKDVLEEIFGSTKFDLVVHLAARAGVRPSLEQPLLYQKVNVEGTLNILECCRKYGVKRLLSASSSSVYGLNEKVPFSEEDILQKMASPYAATKIAGESLCSVYNHLYDIEIACLRFFTVYGPGQRPDMAIHKFTRLIDEGKEIPLYGDGKTKRDYTYIDDIINGMLQLIDADFNFEIFNLGESRVVELHYLVSLIESALGKKAKIQWLPDQPGDVPVTYADISKAKSFFGYNPQTQIEEGIEKFIAWYNGRKEKELISR